MHLKFIDLDDECKSFRYNQLGNIFEICNKQDEVVCEYYPQLNLNPGFDPHNFKYYLLRNERDDYSENCIFQVYVSKKRIGWIFPIQALQSNQHEYSEDVHFLKYAYVASYLLIQDIESINEKELPLENILLSDFYDEKLTVLILDKENINSIEDFSLEDYTVSLFQKGYSYSGKGNLTSEIEKEDKRINLKPIAKELRNIKYIHTLFSKEIPKEQEAFAKFHVYYQIIEILIALIFEDKFGKFVKALDDDRNLLFDKRDELGTMVLEKQRVKWLFSNYVNVSMQESVRLNSQCEKILSLNEKKIHKTMAENLYSVRCLLVHNMYILNEESHDVLEEINRTFLDVLMEILLSFNIPD